MGGVSVAEQPNLFNFATSELSQDAFICWLLSWAAPAWAAPDREFDHRLLNECAKRLLDIFFEKHQKHHDKHHKIDKPSSYNSVEVRKQDNFIDVLCIINNDIYVLIEDKTGTENHSDQLCRYVENLKKNIPEDKILPIYFKTGDQSNYGEIHKNGYIVFSRSDFLEVLNDRRMSGITNQIFLDYRNYLQKIDDEVKSYKILPVSEWKWESWKGFFIELQHDLLEGGNWGYVPNPSGGFLGFWWHSQGDDQCEQYIQLEQEKCCFKIRVNDSSQRAKLRNQWHQIIRDTGCRMGLNIAKPQRFGNGQYMTVAILNEEYRKKKTNGTIDMSSTVDFLKKAEIVLETIATKGVTH